MPKIISAAAKLSWRQGFLPTALTLISASFIAGFIAIYQFPGTFDVSQEVSRDPVVPAAPTQESPLIPVQPVAAESPNYASGALEPASETIGMGWGTWTKAECKSSIRQLTAALKRNPRNAAAYCKRAWMYNTMGAYKKGAQDARRALRYSNDPAIKDALSFAQDHIE